MTMEGSLQELLERLLAGQQEINARHQRADARQEKANAEIKASQERVSAEIKAAQAEMEARAEACQDKARPDKFNEEMEARQDWRMPKQRTVMRDSWRFETD
jgi:hypothetical protein